MTEPGAETSREIHGKEFEPESYVIEVSEQDVQLLARLIQAEAEAEPEEGRVAVGAVVVNRVRHPGFPNSITAVIMEKGQFEAVANGRLASIVQPNKECLEAALWALRGIDPSGGALFFFNPHKTSNRWLKEKEIKVALGRHLFVG